MKAVRTLIICWLLTFVATASAQTTARHRQTASAHTSKTPDVFLVTIDTLRADHVHCYGDANIATPALDGLAADGVRFTNAFTPSPITNTSHTTILTGLLPSHHGVNDFAVPLASTHVTWAELLKSKGYHTAAFIGAVILDSKSLAPGLDRGFDYYDNFPEHPQTKSRWDRVERRGMEVVEHAEAWLTKHPSGPHFVWVHLYDPHDPYEPPPPYSTEYKDRPYDGEIAYADSAFANFISYLKKRGWYENSLIFVTGDHGEGLGEHHEETHGIFLYDSTTHVPLIVKLPAAASRGKIAEAQVRTTDILPTVIDMLHVETDSKFDGESLKPYFIGADAPARTAIGETDYPLRFGWAPLRSVRADGDKFIEAPHPEFYDLHSDPKELKNTYQPNSPTVQKFRGVLTQVGATVTAEAAKLPDPKDRIDEQNLLHSAMLASDDNRDADARTALEKVLQLDPKSPTALRQLGELEFKAADYSKAAEHLKQARAIRADDATAALYEGEAREKVGDLGGARDALEASLKLLPSQLPARLLLGNVYLRLKDPKAAEDQFEAAQLLDSNSVDAQVGIAKVQIAQGQFKDAVAQLEPLSKTQSSNQEVFALLAQAYKGLGQTAEAQDAARKAASLQQK